MSEAARGTPGRYALLIGIDFYFPNRLPGDISYSNLGGCVRDISHVEEFLRSKLGLVDENIFKLTATSTGGREPAEPREQWPTYENIVAAFHRIAEVGRAGDHVYIQYSGHGGRAPTAFPELKGEAGLDEALVPTDIGDSAARYVRDVELAHLLRTMVERGLVLTVVLDSCHSGGTTRGRGGAVARGIGVVDTTPRPTDSLVASPGELAATWQAQTAGTGAAGARGFKVGSGWLLEPRGYVLLAACRASESAYEFAFDGRERNGALTYWLLDSLKQIGPGLTYEMLHERILAKVHSQFEQQTPQLQGEADRVVFGSDRVRPAFAATVLQVERGERRILINAGQAQGLRKEAQLAVYPLGAADLTHVEGRLALVQIDELGAADSWATVTARLRQDPIEQGAQAVLVDPGTVKLRRAVQLTRRDNLPAPSTQQDAALEAVRAILGASGGGFVRLAGDNEPADFQVVVDGEGAYQVWDAAGVEIANLRPAIRAADDGAAARLVERLVHLAKYRNVQELDNRDPMSPLARKLVVELLGVQAEFDPADEPEPRPFDDPGNTPTLDEGLWTFLRVRNTLPPGEPNDPLRILNITVLDLQPDWGISQIYPAGAAFFEPLDPGQELVLPLQASVPPGYDAGADILKVFATLGTTNFRWLELQPLDQGDERSPTTRGGPSDPLEELLAAVAADEPKERNLNPAAFPSRDWVTAQVEVRVRRVGGSS